jgi:hypothetical protein
MKESQTILNQKTQKNMYKMWISYKKKMQKVLTLFSHTQSQYYEEMGTINTE